MPRDELGEEGIESEWSTHQIFTYEFHIIRKNCYLQAISENLNGWYLHLRSLKRHGWPILTIKERETIKDQFVKVNDIFKKHNGTPINHPSRKKIWWELYNVLEDTEEIITIAISKHVPLIQPKIKEGIDDILF